MRLRGALLVGVLVGGWLGCGSGTEFHCAGDAQCSDGMRQGVCTDTGYCAFENDECVSGLQYGELAPGGLSGMCVPSDGTGDGSTTAPSSTSNGSADATSNGSLTGDESGPSEPCPAGVGQPCQPDDPCALSGLCGADGTCVATEVITCDQPPGSCFGAEGTCTPEGGCIYTPLPSLECEDGDPCTVGDQCDERGECVPGPMCPVADPCQPSMCTPEGCAMTQLPDGTSCGPVAADRCCGGTCVDISSDTMHCGGCNTACAPGQACESVEVTLECVMAPADTSGRCLCQDDAQCPTGQLCNVAGQYPGRCDPDTNADCAGVVVSFPGCPDFCTY